LRVPLVVGPGFNAYRADLRRLNRFHLVDWQVLRSRSRRDRTIRAEKPNSAALTAGSIVVLLGSGLLMYPPPSLACHGGPLRHSSTTGSPWVSGS
jgi:hypothetical protein